MKKVLLLGVSAFIGLGAMAQQKQKPIVFNAPQGNVERPQGKNPSKLERPTSKSRAASRWYDIVDAQDKAQGGGGGIYQNDAYNVTWTDSTIIYPYGSSTAPTYDGVWIKSLQQVIDPVDPKFNSADYAGEGQIRRVDPYKVDSVEILGIYERAPSKASVVDTLIVSMAYGSGGTTDLDIFYFASPDIISNYGDTVRFASTDQNVGTFIAKGSNVWSKKIPLTAANANDTLSNGFNVWRLAPNLNVPAGNLVAMTVTFKSGDTWTPFMDTIRKAGATTSNYNHFRFVAFEETAGAFQSYQKNYYNASGLMLQDTTDWGGTYVPSYAFTSATWSIEHYWWFYKLHCPTCWTVGVDDVTNINNLNVFPNPSNSEVNFNFGLNEAAKNVSIQITNTIGQVVKNINVGRAQGSVNQKVNVSDLSSGLYIYTIDVDGQKTSNKLMVK